MEATFSRFSNDLFWTFYTPTEFKGKGEKMKVISGDKLEWGGYNDSYWREEVSTKEGYNQRTDTKGNVWQIDFETNEVILFKAVEVVKKQKAIKAI
jgi:hypothetical protein